MLEWREETDSELIRVWQYGHLWCFDVSGGGHPVFTVEVVGR